MKKLLFVVAGMVLSTLSLAAQKSAADVAKDANNPLASIKALSMHNVYTPSMYGAEGTMNTAWIRYAQPIGRVLIRASLPVNTLNAAGIDRSGLGDFNIFGTYVLTNPASNKQFGLGPILTCPTATSRALGSGKWQLGAAVVAYFGESDVFQMGMLATWQHSFAGADSRNKTQIASVQPFLMFQLGRGLYLRNTAIHYFDLENGVYIIPMGVGIGKIIKAGNLIFNLFAEPQFTLWHEGAGSPKTQIFVGINTQF